MRNKRITLNIYLMRASKSGCEMQNVKSNAHSIYTTHSHRSKFRSIKPIYESLNALGTSIVKSICASNAIESWGEFAHIHKQSFSLNSPLLSQTFLCPRKFFPEFLAWCDLNNVRILIELKMSLVEGRHSLTVAESHFYSPSGIKTVQCIVRSISRIFSFHSSL